MSDLPAQKPKNRFCLLQCVRLSTYEKREFARRRLRLTSRDRSVEELPSFFSKMLAEFANEMGRDCAAFKADATWLYAGKAPFRPSHTSREAASSETIVITTSA